MSIVGIGGLMSGVEYPKDGAGKGRSPEETFLSCMKKSPVGRWVENWLAARGLAKEEFDAHPRDQHGTRAKWSLRYQSGLNPHMGR